MPVHTFTSRAHVGAIERYLEVSLFLLMLAGTLALATTGKLDLPSTVLPVFLLLVKAWRHGRGRGPELSPRAARWLVAACVLFVPVDLWLVSSELARGAPVPLLYAALLTAVHLMLFAMVVRLYSARTLRDYAFLALLSFAMMLAAAVFTVDTTYLVFFLLFLVLAVSTFAGLEMRRSAEGAVVQRIEPRSPAAGRLHRALRWTSTGMAVSALVVGAGLFFLIPRYHAGYLGAYTLQPQLISGFDDDVELGQIGEIKKNPEIVMRVRVSKGLERAPELRWRGIALTVFDGRRWFNAFDRPFVVEPSQGGWYRLGYIPAGLYQHSAELRFSVLLEPLASNAIFVPYRALAVRGAFSPEPERARHIRRSYILLDATESLSNPYQNFTRRLYEGVSLVPAVPRELLRTAATDYPEPIRKTYLQLPEIDSRVRALAEGITAGATTPYDKAVTLEHHLRTRFGYTLSQPELPPDDPLAHFLFVRRAGHCEYFATAMTVMLRALGIPARYVNGFLTGEYNDIGEDFIVRASDAHSWVEVYFPDYGWIPFDPTPPSDEAARGWLGRLALYWDWLELNWHEWVINYDTAHQQTLAQSLARNTREWLSGTRQFWRRQRRAAVEGLKAWQAALADSPYALPGALVLMALGVFLFRRRAIADWLARRWGWSVGRSEQAAARVATLRYRELLRLLERRGYHKLPGQTPREFAHRIPLPHLRDFTEIYEAARYGGRPAELARLGELLAHIRRTFDSNADSHAA